MFNDRCVLVLGSHRSGTSVVTRAISAVGVYLGNDLIVSGADNQKGFFEDRFSYHNEKFLNSIGCRWNTLLLPEISDTRCITGYQQDIHANLFSRFNGNALWGLKDPRISRLWPYWMPAFSEADIEPIFVLANRHPFSVASSLAKRNRMSETHALALWAVHQLDALAALLQYGGLVIDYDLIILNPLEELHRIARFIDNADLLESDEVSLFIDEFLTEDLWHNRHSSQDIGVLGHTPLQLLCLQIYAELLNFAKRPGGLNFENTAHAHTMITKFREELSKSFEWMRAIDALHDANFIATKLESQHDISLQSEARQYISEVVDSIVQPYTEFRSSAASYPISSQRQTVRLPMPGDLKSIASLRLDLASRPVALLLHRLTLLLADGTELWFCDGDASLFKDIGDLAIRDTPEGLLLLSLSDDPRFVLNVPPSVLAKLQANGCLVVDLTPRPLLQVISEVLTQDDRLITCLRSDLESMATLGAQAVLIASSSAPLFLSKNLENLASLLSNGLQRRDQIIAQQSIQINTMRYELLRAEAQLDFLKDVMLGSRGDEQL